MIDIDKLNEEFKELSAQERIKVAVELFQNRLAITTSGGRTSAVLLNLFKEAFPQSTKPVFFIDTRYYPVSTYKQVEWFMKNKFKIITNSAQETTAMQEALYGKPHEMNPEEFEEFKKRVKHDPLNELFFKYNINAWLRGIRQSQSTHRAEKKYVELVNGVYQIHPILDWSEGKTIEYMKKHNLPENKDHFDITKVSDENNECGIESSVRAKE